MAKAPPPSTKPTRVSAAARHTHSYSARAQSAGGANADEPLFITFWDIRRAFDSIPKWIQRLAWARLGFTGEDLEWFLGLDSTGHITIRTPYQQQHMKSSNGHQVLSGEKMLRPHKHSFHPARGIGQEDTPSTLIFIAVFDILLTLLDESETGDAHAYADDLAHLAKTLEANNDRRT